MQAPIGNEGQLAHVSHHSPSPPELASIINPAPGWHFRNRVVHGQREENVPSRIGRNRALGDIQPGGTAGPPFPLPNAVSPPPSHTILVWADAAFAKSNARRTTAGTVLVCA